MPRQIGNANNILTVADVIEALRKMPPDAIVVTENDAGYPWISRVEGPEDVTIRVGKPVTTSAVVLRTIV